VTPVWAALWCAVAVLAWPKRPVAWRWAGRRRVQGVDAGWREPETAVADAMEHLALALSGGVGVQAALREVSHATGGAGGRELAAVSTALAAGADDDAAWARVPARWDPARRALGLASYAGVAPADLLRGAAADLRRDALARVEVETAKLSVRLVLPLGLAFLPAFVLLTVVPVVTAVATSLTEQW